MVHIQHSSPQIEHHMLATHQHPNRWCHLKSSTKLPNKWWRTRLQPACCFRCIVRRDCSEGSEAKDCCMVNTSRRWHLSLIGRHPHHCPSTNHLHSMIPVRITRNTANHYQPPESRRNTPWPNWLVLRAAAAVPPLLCHLEAPLVPKGLLEAVQGALSPRARSG